jgi:hypothetical protein
MNLNYLCAGDARMRSVVAAVVADFVIVIVAD